MCLRAFRKGSWQLWLHVKEGTQKVFKTLHVLATNHMGKLNMANLGKKNHILANFLDFPPLNHVELLQPFFFVAKWCIYGKKKIQNIAAKWQKSLKKIESRKKKYSPYYMPINVLFSNLVM